MELCAEVGGGGNSVSNVNNLSHSSLSQLKNVHVRIQQGRHEIAPRRMKRNSSRNSSEEARGG